MEGPSGEPGSGRVSGLCPRRWSWSGPANTRRRDMLRRLAARLCKRLRQESGAGPCPAPPQRGALLTEAGLPCNQPEGECPGCPPPSQKQPTQPSQPLIRCMCPHPTWARPQLSQCHPGGWPRLPALPRGPHTPQEMPHRPLEEGRQERQPPRRGLSPDPAPPGLTSWRQVHTHSSAGPPRNGSATAVGSKPSTRSSPSSRAGLAPRTPCVEPCPGGRASSSNFGPLVTL